jgi:hypothetical protein
MLGAARRRRASPLPSTWASSTPVAGTSRARRLHPGA